jgi:molecular chaperone DnaK
MLLADARQAVKEEAGLDRLRSLTAELQSVYQGLMAPPSAGSPSASGGGGSAGASGRPGPTSADGDGSGGDVIDAEFTPG